MSERIRPVGRPLIMVAGMVCVAVALSSCGRKGDPEMPGAMATKAAPGAKAEKKMPVEDKPFLLDPLL